MSINSRKSCSRREHPCHAYCLVLSYPVIPHSGPSGLIDVQVVRQWSLTGHPVVSQVGILACCFSSFAGSLTDSLVQRKHRGLLYLRNMQRHQQRCQFIKLRTIHKIAHQRDGHMTLQTAGLRTPHVLAGGGGLCTLFTYLWLYTLNKQLVTHFMNTRTRLTSPFCFCLP